MHKTMHRVEALEAAVAALVDGELLTDRETLERHLDAAAERERAVGPELTPGAAETLSGRLSEIANRRAAYQDQQAAGLMTLPELAEKLRALEEQSSAVEGELERARHAAERAAETERAKRAVLSMFGTGLMLGLHWFPPRLRRHVYGLMALRVAVYPGGDLELEGRFDVDLMKLTPEVEAWVAGLREIDERTRGASLDAIERELATLRSRMALRAGEATPG